MYESRPEFEKAIDPEARLYDGFVSDMDKVRVEKVRQSDGNALADMHPEFSDDRLGDLLLHYKARNYPKSLAEDEMTQWEDWRARHVMAQLPAFANRLQQLATVHAGDESKEFILQELQLWAESIVPVDA